MSIWIKGGHEHQRRHPSLPRPERVDRIGFGQGRANYPCDDLPGSEGNTGGIEFRDDLKALAFPLRKRPTQNGSGKIVAKEKNNLIVVEVME